MDENNMSFENGQPVGEPTVAQADIICPVCNAQIPAGARLCPVCGTPVSIFVNPQAEYASAAPAVQDGMIPDQPAVYQPETAAPYQVNGYAADGNNTKKKKKGPVALLVVLLVIALAVGGYFYMDAQYKKLSSHLVSGNVSASTVKSGYVALTPVGQAIYKSKITDSFRSMIRSDPYKTQSDELVSSGCITRYKTYKTIADSLHISPSEPSRVYVETILKLEPYIKYNGILKCVNSSKDSFIKSCNYIQMMSNAYSYITISVYANGAYTSAALAYTQATNNSNGDEYCRKYVSALYDIEVGLKALKNGDLGEKYKKVSPALGVVTDLCDEVSKAANNVADIIKQAPTTF